MIQSLWRGLYISILSGLVSISMLAVGHDAAAQKISAKAALDGAVSGTDQGLDTLL